MHSRMRLPARRAMDRLQSNGQMHRAAAAARRPARKP